MHQQLIDPNARIIQNTFDQSLIFLIASLIFCHEARMQRDREECDLDIQQHVVY